MNAAIIVAAGRGLRMGGAVPKQFLALDGMPVIRHTLLAFLAHPEIAHLRVVIHADDQALFAAATEGLALAPPVLGGATRGCSVRRGLDSLAGLAPRHVLIHDAVRPFVAPETISAVLRALQAAPAVITGMQVADTLKRCRDGVVTATLDRTDVWRAQTPQGFAFPAILAAHQAAGGDAELTDDAMVIERHGVPVRMIEGGEDNFKITTARDLERAERILKARKNVLF